MHSWQWLLKISRPILHHYHWFSSLTIFAKSRPPILSFFACDWVQCFFFLLVVYVSGCLSNVSCSFPVPTHKHTLSSACLPLPCTTFSCTGPKSKTARIRKIWTMILRRLLLVMAIQSALFSPSYTCNDQKCMAKLDVQQQRSTHTLTDCSGNIYLCAVHAL